MAESSFPDAPSYKKSSTPKVVEHIKMELIEKYITNTAYFKKMIEYAQI